MRLFAHHAIFGLSHALSSTSIVLGWAAAGIGVGYGVLQYRRALQVRAEMKKLRADFTRVNERAASVRGEKGHILRIVEQEIGEPLGAMRPYLQQARAHAAESMDARLRGALELADSEVQRIERGVASLAEIQRLDDRSRSVLLGTINVNTLVMEAAASAREVAEKKSIRISIPAPTKVSLARGDATILRKVLSALIFQAIEVSPVAAAVSLSFYQTSDRVLITVSDEGPGAVSTDQAHMLAQSGDSRPIQMAQKAASPVNLAMAHNLVKAMQGWLWSQSEPGRGTTHVLELPLPTQAEDAPFAASS